MDGNGFIMGDELRQMVDWVWALFHPGAAAMENAQRDALAKNLLAKVDKNSDGKLALAEFAPWFTEVRQKIAETGVGKK